MSKPYSESRDDLVVFVSLAPALGILLSAIVVMWIWSSVNAERGLAIP